MHRYRRLVHGVHRRSVWQALTVYVFASWIVLQVADTATAALGLPHWFSFVALVMLITLLPVVLGTASVQEGVGGVAGRPEPSPTPDAETAESDTPVELPRAEPQAVHHRVSTWRNAIAAAAAILVLPTVSGTGYVGLRAAGVGPFATRGM